MIDAPLPEDEDGAEEVGSVLTPLVDVIFMLVVFLLLTANAAQFALEVDPPSSTRAQTADRPQTILLAVPVDGTGWRIDDGPPLIRVEAEAALAAAVRNRPEAAVTILAARGSTAQDLIDALDVARAAGAAEVDVAVVPPGRP